MARPTRTIDATAAELQQVLDRNYAHLEWRVLVSPAPHSKAATEHQIHVHARTRDFRYRCRVSRPWPVVRAARTLRTLVAALASEAEQLLAALAASSAGVVRRAPLQRWMLPAAPVRLLAARALR